MTLLMSILSRRSRCFCCSIILGALAVLPAFSQERTVRIGTVIDGPRDLDLAFIHSVQRELTRLLDSRFLVEFPENRQIVGDWSATGVRTGVDRLLSDPNLDAVLVVGIIGPAYATRLDDIPRPLVAAVVIDP